MSSGNSKLGSDAAATAKKRKRIKLQCLVSDCNAEFDDDYRHSHNKKYHQNLLTANKNIPYQVAGAIKSPWTSIKATKTVTKQDEVWLYFLSKHFFQSHQVLLFALFIRQNTKNKDLYFHSDSFSS